MASVAQDETPSQPPGPCPACPLAPRLERAKQVYRAQQATLAQLEDALERHRRIGLRLWQQPASQALYGTLVWSENVCLRRENAQYRATIQQQRSTIQALKRLAALGQSPAPDLAS